MTCKSRYCLWPVLTDPADVDVVAGVVDNSLVENSLSECGHVDNPLLENSLIGNSLIAELAIDQAVDVGTCGPGVHWLHRSLIGFDAGVDDADEPKVGTAYENAS